MSRVGKQPISVPGGVQVTVRPGQIMVKGPKGELQRSIPEGVVVRLESGSIVVLRENDEREKRSLHGLMRAHISNMVRGVTDGFARQLEINGVGYRAEVNGNKVLLSLGFSHPVEMSLPSGVQAKAEKTKSTVNAGQDAVLLTVSGMDKEKVGQFVSKIRATRKNEPYKGKGVKYLEEKIKRKVGKTGAG